MFYIDKTTRKMVLTKGDSAEIEVKVFDVNGVERGVYEDDIIIMTVKENIKSSYAVLTKTANNGIITLTPDDTNSLASGKYVYDVQLNAFTGNVYTIIPTSTFISEEDITK